MKREHSPLIATVRSVMPAVVSVIISKHIEDLKEELDQFKGGPKNKSSLLKSIPADKIDADGMVQVGGGSGFVVDESGIVLTNKHVIAEPRASYLVITNEDEQLPATLLARDPINDVAILKIKPKKKLPVVRLGDSKTLELGQTVLAFGNALGMFKNTVSSGIISGLSRSIAAQEDPASPPQELRGLIQTDAAINPGNSGGPLTDLYGYAIGINAAVVSGAQNIGFAIPIHAAEHDLRDLKKYGRIRKPLLGLRYIIITPALQAKMKLPVDYGALVTHEHPFDHAVIPNTPAAKSEIMEGDIILAWDGERITQEKSIQEYLENCEIGQTVTLTIERGRRILKKEVTLAERK